MSVLSKERNPQRTGELTGDEWRGISKIDDQFYKAVPATGMNVHVPIWLDGPASAYAPSQRIYIKMFHLDYAPALRSGSN